MKYKQAVICRDGLKHLENTEIKYEPFNMPVYKFIIAPTKADELFEFLYSYILNQWNEEMLQDTYKDLDLSIYVHYGEKNSSITPDVLKYLTSLEKFVKLNGHKSELPKDFSPCLNQ